MLEYWLFTAPPPGNPPHPARITLNFIDTPPNNNILLHLNTRHDQSVRIDHRYPTTNSAHFSAPPSSSLSLSLSLSLSISLSLSLPYPLLQALIINSRAGGSWPRPLRFRSFPTVPSLNTTVCVLAGDEQFEIYANQPGESPFSTNYTYSTVNRAPIPVEDVDRIVTRPDDSPTVYLMVGRVCFCTQWLYGSDSCLTIYHNDNVTRHHKTSHVTRHHKTSHDVT